MKKENWAIAVAAGVGVAALTYNFLSDDIPKGATAVQPFDKDRYLGLWNEIARMPSLIEKNINQLTEDYSLNDDGTIKVVTKGYNTKKEKWVEVSGNIKFAKSEDLGMLKVSYFGPFYLSYNVLDIDADYKYALVSGSGLDYLWILSKEKIVPEEIKQQFLNNASIIGFKVDKLEWM
jgi:apolipoprotein D and lipocalin family protein